MMNLPRRLWTRSLVLSLAGMLALMTLACSGEAEASPDNGPTTPEVPAPPSDEIDENFDRDVARANAEALIGVAEDDVVTSPMRRVVRRGDEHFAVTMDLRPGRENLELDDDGTGTFVVTKVVIEVLDGDSLEIE